VDVMASIKPTQNCNGVFSNLIVVVAFLKYAKVAMASIQLTHTYIYTDLLETDFDIASVGMTN
jgi:hypothetical protein